MEIPIKCVLEMGNFLALASVGKRAESKSAGSWVADGEWSPRGKGISTGSLIGGGENGCSSMGGGDNGFSSVGGGDDGCSSVGGGDEQVSSMDWRSTVGDGSLGGEVKGEVVSMLTGVSFMGERGDEGCPSVGGGVGEVGSSVGGGLWANISSMEGI
ncbi:hypothetical protein KI387_012830 [Taxus chinensis]|uniref:Uncharacterized protein n=1 Tax=Taxus chinensis TaxID=29808 RepID=A0AA38CJL5_TAXCH|nr:hypothetical protein KI387_012830 [Taxus chinensis]